MKKIIVLVAFTMPLLGQAQKTYTTKAAKVKFFSHTVAEDVEAINNQVVCSINNKTGQVSFAALIKGFKFENSLMQQHFNGKDYMNSDKFSKANFTGTITNITTVNFVKNGIYTVSVDGILTLHGISQNIQPTGVIIVANSKVSLKSTFKIKPKSFGVTVPDGIADELETTVISSF